MFKVDTDNESAPQIEGVRPIFGRDLERSVLHDAAKALCTKAPPIPPIPPLSPQLTRTHTPPPCARYPSTRTQAPTPRKCARTARGAVFHSFVNSATSRAVIRQRSGRDFHLPPGRPRMGPL